MTYDGLGRIKTRIDTCASTTSGNCSGASLTEGNTVWTYDTATYGLGQLASVNDTVSNYLREMTYDSLGRASTATTSFDGGIYYEKTTYDQFGRVFQVFDAGGDGTFQDSGVQHTYNAAGYLESVGDAVQVDGAPRTTYRKITSMNFRGQVTGEVLGNGVITINQYAPTTGRLTNISSNGLGGEVQDLRYHWDTVGNLTYRREYSGTKSLEETFGYDGLNRLTSQQVTGETAIIVTYDPQHIGNIASKSDVGTYAYGASGAGPHAVTSAGGETYVYDANGNNTSGDGRTIEYTTFDKPYEITRDGHTVTFAYGPERSRYRRIDVGADGTTTTRYIGNVEIIDRPNNIRERKRHIAGIVVDTSFYDSGNLIDKQTYYLHKDHLGSLDVMTTTSGYVVSEFSFDAWGQRRDATDWTALSALQLSSFDHSITTRGFTGHEMLDEVGVVHMNGRIYDQKLGRFLQADPVVQDPTNSQSLNRYSYVWNNPLNATDPSGYEVISLVLGAILALVPEIALSSVTAAWLGAAAFVETLIAGGDFFSALISGLSAAAFTALGPQFASPLSFAQFATSVVVFGAVGGMTSLLQGGKFGHGFRSAAIGAAFSGAAGSVSRGMGRLGRSVVDVVAGGTISELTGGKFVNGAATHAFTAALKAISTENEPDAEQLETDSEAQAQEIETLTIGFLGWGGRNSGANPHFAKYVEELGGSIMSMAEAKAAIRSAPKGTEINLVGYSRGGNRAVRLTNWAGKRGIRINALTTFDPHSVRGAFHLKYDNVGVANNYYQRNPTTGGAGILPIGPNPYLGRAVKSEYISIGGQDYTGNKSVNHVNIVPVVTGVWAQ